MLLLRRKTLPSRPCFVDPTDRFLEELLCDVSLDMLQLHGHESLRRVRAIKKRTQLPIIKSVAISSALDVDRACDLAKWHDWLLLDSRPKPGEFGGGNARAF